MVVQEMGWLEAQSPHPGVRLSGLERQLLLCSQWDFGQDSAFQSHNFPIYNNIYLIGLI